MRKSLAAFAVVLSIIACGGNTGNPVVSTAPPVLPTAEETPTTAPVGGARSNPAPLGSFVTVGDMTIKVLDVSPGEAGEMLTTELQPGQQLIQVRMEVTCNLSPDESCYINPLYFSTVGQAGVETPSAMWDTPPDDLNGKSFFGGATVTGNLMMVEDEGDMTTLMKYSDFDGVAWLVLH
jgi:hypothetical protein